MAKGKDGPSKKYDEPTDDQGGDDTGNPSSCGKPIDEYDDLFGDLTKDFHFEGFIEGMMNYGLGDMFTDVSMDSVFDEVCKQQRGGLLGSSSGASLEEEQENIILGNISTDANTDWTPAPLEVQKTWISTDKDDDVENNDLIYIFSSKDLFVVHNDRSTVVSWMYDYEKNVYLIKRFNGKLEYFKRPQDFCSMPKIDLRSINNTVFINLSKDSQAELFAKFLKDQCDKDFPIMKTAKGRRFVSKCILDPVKKEPWIYVKYPPSKTEKAVLVHSRVLNNSLHNFTSCYFNKITFAAVIVRYKSDDYILLDPMEFLMFRKDDMTVLHKNPISTYDGYDQEAKPFKLVVALAMAHKLYVGAYPHQVTLAID
ncbi:hypothetical protein R6Q57_013156 [Mikania cordata]